MIDTNAAAVQAEASPVPTAENTNVADSVLRQVNDIVLDAAEAIHHLAAQHQVAHQAMSAYVQELAETLAGSTVDWIREWPS